ncbi:MAG: OmpA family protein [bacterium]|nr:OmpA family protein [bacterium]
MKLSILFLLVSLYSFSQGPDTLQFYFDTDQHDSFTLSSEDETRLENLYKETRILAILGHCDPRGSEEYNLNLSRQRMEHVRRYLKNEGFDVSKSSNEALGESMAEKSGLSLEKCRRVDVYYIEAVIEKETIPDMEHIEVEEPPTDIEPVDLEDTPIVSTGSTSGTNKPGVTNLSKSAVEKFLDDDSAEDLEFDLSILFHNVSTRPLEESKPELFRLLEIMQNNPTLNATFHGHVCCNPHPELAEGRARTVALFLREYGIAADRLDYTGHSNTQPKVWPEVTDEDRKLNRRVVVVFTKSDE